LFVIALYILDEATYDSMHWIQRTSIVSAIRFSALTEMKVEMPEQRIMERQAEGDHAGDQAVYANVPVWFSGKCMGRKS
jgi:hypothetical protein